MTWQDFRKVSKYNFKLMIFFKLIIYYKILRIYWHSKQELLINKYGFRFCLYDEIEAWVLQMLKSVNQIKVWLDIIMQLRLFFNKALLFSTLVAKAIYTDLSFYKSHYGIEEIEMLLYPIKVHSEVVSFIGNLYEEALP